MFIVIFITKIFLHGNCENTFNYKIDSVLGHNRVLELLFYSEDLIYNYLSMIFYSELSEIVMIVNKIININVLRRKIDSTST